MSAPDTADDHSPTDRVPADDRADADDLEASDDTRRQTLRRMLIGAAFVTPVVSSFSMDGLGVRPSTAEAGVVSSPWTFSQYSRASAGRAFLQPGGTATQNTGTRGSTLAAGAIGVQVRATVLPPTLDTVSLQLRLQIPAASVDQYMTLFLGSFTRDVWFDTPTLVDSTVIVTFRANGGAAVDFDDVAVEGWFPGP
jgi:hypothetical protein